MIETITSRGHIYKEGAYKERGLLFPCVLMATGTFGARCQQSNISKQKAMKDDKLIPSKITDDGSVAPNA